MSGVISLLGAGASMDAGLPSVAQLTRDLKDRLPSLKDINGETRPEFPTLFDVIGERDREAAQNYERFFEWLQLLNRGQMEPFNRVIRFELAAELARAAGPLAFVIKLPIWHALRARHQREGYDPAYLGKLGDFIPAKGRLDVFTLNYDLCVEDACRQIGIGVTTGFGQRGWAPSLFRSPTPGINLHKLHGSLNWVRESRGMQSWLTEIYPPNWESEPEFLLGPAPKLQNDDPFVTLYSAFHGAVRRAKICVVIGYGFGDPHINHPLREASQRGLKIIDFNPSRPQADYRNVPLRAKEALANGVIKKYVDGMLC